MSSSSSSSLSFAASAVPSRPLVTLSVASRASRPWIVVFVSAYRKPEMVYDFLKKLTTIVVRAEALSGLGCSTDSVPQHRSRVIAIAIGR